MVCVVDTSNIFFIGYSIFLKEQKEKFGSDYLIKEEDTGLFFHMLIRKIMDYIISYENIIFCFEGRGSTSYRKSVYPPYKENRKHDDPNYVWVSPLMEKTYEFLKLFHSKCLKVDNAEGDDCIYQACKYYSEKGEPVRIISSDKDLSQIMNFWDTVTQFDPIRKAMVPKNENILLEKAIVGDASDNIKPFRGIGPKTFEKMLSSKEEWNKRMTPEKMEIYEAVLKIVDLRKYPEKYQSAIRDGLSKPWNEFDPISVEKFLLDNGLRQCYNDWTGRWCQDIQARSFEQEDAVDEIMDILNS